MFTVDNMRVMICLGQGGLRSLSASSFESHDQLFKLNKFVTAMGFATLLWDMQGGTSV